MFNWNVLWSEDYNSTSTAQKMNFSIQDFFSKCGQIRRKLRFLSHLLKKSLMENFIFWVQCSVEEDFPSQFNFVASKTAPSFFQRGPIWKTVLEEIFQLFSWWRAFCNNYFCDFLMFNIFKVFSIFRS